MALKGINPIERHFDKVIAGVFAVGLLGVIAWQFVGESNQVKVGATTVPVPDAYPSIANAARQTQARMEAVGVETPAGPDPSAQKIAQFESKLRGPVSPAPQTAIALDKAPPPFSG